MVDLKTYDKIRRKKKFKKEDIDEVVTFIRSHFDPTCKKICYRCPTQLDYALKRIKIWAEKNSSLIEEARKQSKEE